MSFSHDDFLNALAQHDYAFEVGQTVPGKVVNLESEGAYIDIGGKSTALLPVAEVDIPVGGKLVDVLPLGSEREFLIIRAQDAEGQIQVSIRRLEIKALWETFQELQESQAAFEVRVTGVNKGGVTVDARGLRGFIPRTHLPREAVLENLVGQTLSVTVLEADPEKRRLVCSNRVAMRQQRLREFDLGQLVNGKVQEIRPYGMIIDLLGASGLLHISDFSERRVGSLAAHVQVGTPLKAVITNMDSARGRISLSTRVLENRPGEILDDFEHVMAEAEVRAQRLAEKLVPKLPAVELAADKPDAAEPEALVSEPPKSASSA